MCFHFKTLCPFMAIVITVTIKWHRFESCSLEIKNKCRPILVQGLRRDIEINFHGAQWISAWLWIWRNLVGFLVREIFSLKFLLRWKWTKMVKDKNNNNYNKNNSSNSLVFGRWPQSKTILLLRDKNIQNPEFWFSGAHRLAQSVIKQAFKKTPPVLKRNSKCF